MKSVLVTGAAGFIGFHFARRLLQRGQRVFGLDNLNDYYDVQLKRDRLRQLQEDPGFQFRQMDLADAHQVDEVFRQWSPPVVVHLAAQAGVRYSLENPQAYVSSNLVGFNNILEACRHGQVEHLVYASSSSVYGANRKVPFAVGDPVDHPVSLYAATKKSNELVAHAYSHLYGLATTGLRFFTVYGPWGRPDMALFRFTDAIVKGKPIDVYNHGRMQRDFTYVDDIVEGMLRVMERPPRPALAEENSGEDGGSPFSAAPYKLYNIGNHQPVDLLEFIETIERHLGRKAEKRLLPMQPGDVPATFADVDDLARDVGFAPATSIDDGVGRFVAWYRDYYKVS